MVFNVSPHFPLQSVYHMPVIVSKTTGHQSNEAICCPRACAHIILLLKDYSLSFLTHPPNEFVPSHLLIHSPLLHSLSFCFVSQLIFFRVFVSKITLIFLFFSFCLPYIWNTIISLPSFQYLSVWLVYYKHKADMR